MIKLVALLIVALVVVVLIGAGLAFYVFGVSGEGAVSFSRIIPLPALAVNYHPVFMYDYYQNFDALKKYNNSQAVSGLYTNPLLNDDENIKKLVINRLLGEKNIKNLAKKYQVTVTKEMVDEEFTSITNLSGSEEDFKNTIHDLYGFTTEQFKKFIITPIVTERVLREKYNSDANIDQTNKEKVVSEKKRMAESALAKINAGEDFAEVAKTESEDEGTADNGGELGFFAKGEMVKPFEEAAFALEPGQVSGIIETDYGFHIIKVTEKDNEMVKASHILWRTDYLFDNWLQSNLQAAKVWIFIKGVDWDQSIGEIVGIEEIYQASQVTY